MRVLITTDTIGGVWTFTQELAAGLLEAGDPVLLVSFGRMPSAEQQQQCDALAWRFGKSFRYVASDVPLEWMERNECAFEQGSAVLEREAAGFAPELIHSNQLCYGALEMNVPRVVTVHSDVLSWARACRNEPLPASEWLNSYISQTQPGLSNADAVTAPTRWMMGAAAQSFALPDRRAVIPNGRTIPGRFEGPRPLRAVTAGRLWDEAKGISILGQVRSPVPILIAGDSELDSGKGNDAVGPARFLGHLPEPEMLGLLQQSAIYLCLSIYEPFGLAALEAARCGCAVIARRIESLQEVWEDGALYFDHAAMLSGLLEMLARDPQLLEAARRRSFDRAQYFSRDRMVETYRELFSSVLMRTARAAHVA